MSRRTIPAALLVAALITAPLIAVMFLAAQVAGLPFIPFDLFDWVTRELPGDLVTFGIDLMIDTMRFLGLDPADAAKTAEQIFAALLFYAGGIIVGTVIISLLAQRPRRSHFPLGIVAGLVAALPLLLLNLTIGQSALAPTTRITWLLLLFAGWGAALGWATRRAFVPTPVETPAEAAPAVPDVQLLNRRQFLIRLAAGTATITVLSGGLAAALAATSRREEELASVPAQRINGQRVLPNADATVQPAPGTRPEYTPIEDHYKVFIRTEPTIIREEDWVLPIVGLVDNPLQLTLDDLRNNYESRDQYVTLSCISGRIGTSLISTTKWTGVSVQDVLRDAGIQENARYLFITSGDGFYETVSLDLINADERIMFCYAWDDQPLPTDHGFPLRIWIPDRFGMKQPKWITHIDVTDTYTEGYWVERNWDEVAQVKTTSVIDTVALDAIQEKDGQQLVPVGGIAFSGDRGISRVQVRIDGGSWQDAQLREPLSETTWVLWRYDWPFSPGNHTFEVRCAERDGTPQIEAQMSARPSGSTGIHSYEAGA